MADNRLESNSAEDDKKLRIGLMLYIDFYQHCEPEYAKISVDQFFEECLKRPKVDHTKTELSVSEKLLLLADAKLGPSEH